MANTITIKSYNKGLAIHLDPDANIEVIKKDLADKFKESASFFRDAKLAISFEDRELDSFTERDLVNIITANSDVKVTCIAGKNKFTENLLLNALNQLEAKPVKRDNPLEIYKGNLIDGAVIDVKDSVLILGDVLEGASVIANGDIYVFGTIMGQVYCGNNGDLGHIICALDIDAKRLSVSGIKYKSPDKPRWGKKNKNSGNGKIALLEGSEVVIKSIDNNIWTQLFNE